MVSITCTSDMHGQLPNITEPADILILAGDICPDVHTILQAKWLDTVFRDWLKELPVKHVIMVNGNHDLIYERAKHLVPELKCHHLEHSLIELEGLKIFGMPWILPIWGAFQKNEKTLKEKYAQIPDDVDIIVSHGPPYGILDSANLIFKDEEKWPEKDHCGSVSLRNRIFEIKPKLVVFGHIHESYGVHEEDGIIFANVSLMGMGMFPVNNPMTFNL